MSETILSGIVGGILTMLGGFVQNWYATTNQNKAYLREKQHEAYLGYIEALLQVKENQNGQIKFKDYHKKYEIIISKVRMYGSKSVLRKINYFEDLLYECWECNFNVNNIIHEIDNVIKIIRQELNVK